MRALVLTAGVGSRLDPLTRLVAKPAVPVAGRALVERVLGWLHREGVREVVLNLHHRPATITRLVGDGAHLGFSVRYSWEHPLLGSAGGPRRALQLLDADTFLIVNGDTLCDFPLAPMLAAHQTSGADVTMALVPNAAPDRYNGVVLDASDRVTGFVPKGRAQGSWHFVGVQIVRGSIFAGLPDGVPAETVASLYRDGLSGAIRIHGHQTSTMFLDVGTPADYLNAALQLADAPDGRVVEPGAAVDASARITRSVVWPDVTIAGGVTLDRCIVMSGVQLPAGFSARDSVLVPASIVRAGESAAFAL